MVHVPYRGCSEPAADVLGGQIDLATLSSSVALPHVQNGRLKVFATTIGRRMPGAPDIPAFKESHVPALKDYEFVAVMRKMITMLNAMVRDDVVADHPHGGHSIPRRRVRQARAALPEA
jgi:tripartite-type tricarboxylate transporter receptor subunit TctC